MRLPILSRVLNQVLKHSIELLCKPPEMVLKQLWNLKDTIHHDSEEEVDAKLHRATEREAKEVQVESEVSLHMPTPV